MTNPKHDVRASPPMLILDNKIKYVSLVVFLGNPTNKIVTGTAYTWDY
jgi:hypothetical protein